ncbi:hypothetical protein C8R46DRAFT_1209875 [Mycena filopes]|nr:hypothetical protein C8R46DRAFT_1209875 [Mycena filopes]
MPGVLSVHRVPAEVLALVFGDVCVELDPSDRAFRFACNQLASVSSVWRSVALSTPSFWRTLLIECSTPHEYLDLFLIRSSARPILVVFSALQSARVAGDLPLDRLLFASAGRIIHTIHRWIALELYVDYKFALAPLAALFIPLRAPSLRFLSVTCRAFNFNPDSPLFAPGPLLFGGLLGGLKYLSLDGVPLPWPSLSPLPHLVHLSLFFIPREAWPTIAQFLGLLASSPSLSELRLHCVGFAGQPPVDLQPAVFSHIRHIQLGFDIHALPSTPSLYRMLACVRFPRLARLRLEFMNGLAVKRFLQSPLTFSAIHLGFSGACGDSGRMRAVYARVSGVLTLDVRTTQARSSLLDALGVCTPEDGGVPFPSLETLCVRLPDWRALHAVLRSRSALGSRPIQTVRADIPSAADVAAPRVGSVLALYPTARGTISPVAPYVFDSELPACRSVESMVLLDWILTPPPLPPCRLSVSSFSV